MIRIFRHYLPKGLLILGLSEMLVLWGALYVGVLLRSRSLSLASYAHATSNGKALLFIAVMLTVMTAFGLYQRDLKEGRWGYFPRLVVSLSLGFIVFCLLVPLVPELVLPPPTLAYVVLVALCGTMLTRLLYVAIASRAAINRQVLVLGTGRRARAVQALAKGTPGHPGFHVVGFVPCGENDERGGAVLRGREPLSAIAKRNRVTEIVVGSRDRRLTLPINELLECKLSGVRVMDLTTFFERESGRIELESLNGSWLVFADGFQQGLVKTWVKRVFDVVASTALLIVCAPVMALTALLIKLEDGGPVFYRQDRVGQGNRPFALLKFRSMRVNAEPDGAPQWAAKNDERVTRLGGFLRKLRIDELPQALNVLRGDMSFVGPRPERPFFVCKLTESIPYYGYRHTIKPGITGWAQVRYPYGASVEDAVEKLKYDLYYVKNNSLFLDLIILFQTLQVVIFQDGAR